MKVRAPFPARNVFVLSVGAFSVLFLLVSFYMFGQLRHSELGLIDDHEILRFLGPDHVIRLSDIPSILFGQTEVGRWGHDTRLRPVYYLVRIIESALWGTDTGLWYSVRVVIVAFTAMMASVTVLRATLRGAADRLQQSLTVLISLIAGVLVLTLPAWSDIATRMGPAETYVAPAIAVFALGAVEIWATPARKHGWILLVVGYLLAVGSKEDCLVLIVPLLVVTLAKFGPARRPRFLIILFAIAATATAYEALGIALGTAGVDIYGNRRTAGLLVDVLSSNPFLASTLFFTVIALIWDVSRLAPGKDTGSSTQLGRALSWLRLFPFTLVSALTVALVIGEAFLYQNYYSEGVFSPVRYGFITELCLVVGFVTLLAIVARLVSTAGALRWSIGVAAAIGLTLTVLSTPLADHLTQFNSARPLSIALAAQSQFVSQEIQQGIADVRDHGGSQVVLVVDQPLDYERVQSLSEFLAYYGATDAVYLQVRIPPQADPFLSQLTSDLEHMQKNGKQDNGWRILPAASRDTTANTVCFYFQDPPADLSSCDSAHRIG